ALLHHDESILTAVDHGDRLAQMQDRLRQSLTSGTVVIAHYRFDSLSVSLLVPFGVQTGLSLGFTGRGTVTEETYDRSGKLTAKQSSTFDLTFAMRRATGARWLLVAVLPVGSPG
ncbi:MAG: hypothetical protein ACM3O7_03435, partial [Acidobacteriota bacterium]